MYRSLGLEPGDRVAFCTANRVELAIALFAALRAGLVGVPLSPLSTPHELTGALERSGARAIVADQLTLKGIDTPDGVLPLTLDPDTGDDAISLPSSLGTVEPIPPHPTEPGAPALIFYTSGTTGEPKGATIPHGALGSVIRRQARVASLLPTSRQQLALLVMPLAHSGGFTTLLVTACLGIPSLVLSRFDARGILETIERDRPTIFAGSPAMYRMLIEAGAEGYDLSSIRVWGGGADTFDRDLLCTLRSLGGWRRWGVGLKPFTVVGYGASEAAGQVTITPPFPVGDRCIGWVLPGFEHRVVDEDGRGVGRGAVGELNLRGGTLMSGYWEDAETTAGSFSGRWYRTGDLVRRGRLGLLYFEGRTRDVITSGGYTIAAAEIERVLEAHPAVSQAAAVGLPDPVKGELPVAAVVLERSVPAPAPGELEGWAAERLSAYKRPRRLVVVDTLPMSPAFKARKGEVRAMLLERT